MSDQEATKINAAVADCLQRCYGEKTPLSAVADYIHHLNEQPGWKAEEVAIVEMTVLRMLTGMLDSTDDSAS